MTERDMSAHEGSGYSEEVRSIMHGTTGQLIAMIARLEQQLDQSQAEAAASHAEAADAALALRTASKESAEKISRLERQIEDERIKHEANVRDVQMEATEKMAAERAQNEIDFQELRHSFEEDLESTRQQMEDAATQQVAEVEAVWSARYAEVKGKLEKAIAEMRVMRQKAQEMRKLELEALDSSGKTLAQQMEEAMKLIRQAQDQSLSERLRYSSALLDDPDCPSILMDKENSIPSPSSIRAQYSMTARKSSVPRSTPRTGLSQSVC